MRLKRARLEPSWLVKVIRWIGPLVLALGALAVAPGRSAAALYPVFSDMGSPQAVEIAERILSWQLPHGGWGKNLPIADRRWTPGTPKSSQRAGGVELGSIDNGATTSEMRYLAAVYHATGDDRFKEGFLRGLDFLLAMQYPTGGWPQVYPHRGDYADYVTFNDDAMIRVMELLKEVHEGGPLYAFVDEEQRSRVADALRRGVEFILAAQIEVDGRLTAWCAQHDPWTFEPRPGRPYEHVSLSGAETVGIVRFLMSLPDPDERVRRAILSALLWLEEAQLPDGRWARFYEIGTNRPIFSGRDGIVRYDISEIESERREGYAWYGDWPRDLLHWVRARGILRELFMSLPGFETPLVSFVEPDEGTSEPVKGDLRLEFLVESHAPETLERVTLLVDGEITHEEPVHFAAREISPGDLEGVGQHGSAADAGQRVASLTFSRLFDTTALADGRHTLEVQVTYAGGKRVSRRTEFVVRNGWERSIAMRAPEDHGWFGVIDYLGARERSEGWEFVVEHRNPPFGHVYRMRWPGTSREHVAWEAKGLREVEVVVLSRLPSADGVTLEVEWSLPGQDRAVWERVAYTVVLEGPSPEGWYQLRLVAEVDRPEVGSVRLLSGGAESGDGVESRDGTKPVAQGLKITVDPGARTAPLEIASVRMRGTS